MNTFTGGQPYSYSRRDPTKVAFETLWMTTILISVAGRFQKFMNLMIYRIDKMTLTFGHSLVQHVPS